MKPPNRSKPDPELVGLVAGFLDNQLDADGRDRLEGWLRADPMAREYCADQIEFASLLHSALFPEPVEITETRRWMLGGSLDAPEWRMEQERGIRFRKPGDSRAESGGGWQRSQAWLLGAGGLIALSGLVAWWRWPDQVPPVANTPLVAASTPPLPPKPLILLRNPGFEAMDLGLSPNGRSSSLLDWQDVFPMRHAMLCDISRVSAGRIFARAGKNVAELNPRGYITQHLRHSDGRPLSARSGLKVRLAGWTYLDGATTGNLRCSLDVIVSGRPDVIEYEAQVVNHPLKTGGWERFELVLELPGNLTKRPHYVNGDAINAPPLNISGRELFLTIENRRPEEPATVYLDDLEIAVLDR